MFYRNLKLPFAAFYCVGLSESSIYEYNVSVVFMKQLISCIKTIDEKRQRTLWEEQNKLQQRAEAEEERSLIFFFLRIVRWMIEVISRLIFLDGLTGYLFGTVEKAGMFTSYSRKYL